MAKVARSSVGTTHKGTLVLKTLKVTFQKYPGTAGSKADRAIASFDFQLQIAGKVAKRGKTDADGTAVVKLPAGSNGALEIFGTRYTLSAIPSMPSLPSVKGRQRRLQHLGYELGEVDGSIGPKTGNAILNFQADNAPLDTDGTAGAPMQAQLKTQFGE